MDGRTHSQSSASGSVRWIAQTERRNSASAKKSSSGLLHLVFGLGQERSTAAISPKATDHSGRDGWAGILSRMARHEAALVFSAGCRRNTGRHEQGHTFN